MRSTPASPLRTSPATRGSVLAPLQTSPPNKPAEGSGLLGESQLSLRAEHAYPHSPPKPGHARLRTSPSPHTLRTSQPKALDCCQHYSSLSRTECACPPSPYKYHAREAPYSHLSPPALSNLKSQIPLSPSLQNTHLQSPPTPSHPAGPPENSRRAAPPTVSSFLIHLTPADLRMPHALRSQSSWVNAPKTIAILRETILTPRVNRLLEAVQTLESNHSSLVTAPNGDRYLRIAPFEK